MRFTLIAITLLGLVAIALAQPVDTEEATLFDVDPVAVDHENAGARVARQFGFGRGGYGGYGGYGGFGGFGHRHGGFGGFGRGGYGGYGGFPYYG